MCGVLKLGQLNNPFRRVEALRCVRLRVHGFFGTRPLACGCIIWYFPKIGGPQYRPPNTIVLIMGAPKRYS